MSNGTNMVVHFDGKGGNLYLSLWPKVTHTIYAKFEQTITRQHVLLRQESFTDGTMVTIIIVFARCNCTSHISIFGYVDYFQ